MGRRLGWLKGWEGFLLVILIAVVAFDVVNAPFYLQLQNQINLFELHIEEIIVALTMTFLIINAEIDLTVGSVMGLAGCVMAFLWEKGVPIEVGIAAGLVVGLVVGAFNGFMTTYVGLSSLIVTLAGLIGYRGLAHVLLEDRSISNFPKWFNQFGQQPLIGPFPFAVIAFFVMLVIALVILQRTGFGRYVYVIGNNKEVARYSGVNVRRIKMTLFVASGLVAAFAGLLLAARTGSMRGDTASGTELTVITMVVLGGVSIFGGTGSLFGVLLSILITLNLRNGMGLLNISGDIQTGVIGMLLVVALLVPPLANGAQDLLRRRRRTAHILTAGEQKGGEPQTT
jgi:rhamnose transport system permease protein